MTNEKPDANPPTRLGLAPATEPLDRPDINPPKPNSRPRPQVQPRNWMGRISRFALIAVLGFAAYFFVSRHVVGAVQVVGKSMEPTLHEHSRYLVYHCAFRHCRPHRRDVVIIRDPEDQGLSVKRIIAVEGDSIYFKRGRIYVNGRELKETYLPQHTYTWTYNRAHEQLIVCGKGRYFVLGDNRQVSIDSRAYGAVPAENILGELMMNP